MGTAVAGLTLENLLYEKKGPEPATRRSPLAPMSVKL